MVTQGAGEIRNGARNDRAPRQKGVIAIAGALVAMLALATALFGAARADAVPPSVVVTPGQAVYEARGGEAGDTEPSQPGSECWCDGLREFAPGGGDGGRKQEYGHDAQCFPEMQPRSASGNPREELRDVGGKHGGTASRLPDAIPRLDVASTGEFFHPAR